MASFYRTIRSFGLKSVRFVLALVIPVKKGKIMFQSTPDYSDNARAFSDYLIENSDYQLLWSVSDCKQYKNSERIKFIEKDGGATLKGKLQFIYDTVSSQYLISTHAAFLYANKIRQTFVCCWHGMPLKRIAQWQNPENKNYLNNTRYILSTSKYYLPILSKCFRKKEDEIVVTGYPRNDWLFKETDVLDKMQLELGKEEKLIMYLPTFRKPSNGGYTDSETDVFKTGPIDVTTETGLVRLNDYLRELHLKMIVKPHPSEANQLGVHKLSNLIVIPHKYFIDEDIQLNKVLHYADALVTDFSGAFIDYLNLDRPIGFVLSDMSEYNENRGFVFDKPLDYLPGMKIYNESDFKQFCEEVASGKDTFQGERERLRYIYNDYSDGNNCERLAKHLGLKIK